MKLPPSNPHPFPWMEQPNFPPPLRFTLGLRHDREMRITDSEKKARIPAQIYLPKFLLQFFDEWDCIT